MLTRRHTRATATHPADLLLGQLAEGSEDDATVRAHVAGCPRCSTRVRELQRIRTMVRESALRYEEVPTRDLAGGALARLRAHRRMGTQVNEVLASFATFWRSLALLFASRDGDQQPRDRNSTPHAEEDARHG